MIADDVTGRDFVTNIIVTECNLGDVPKAVREDLFRYCDDLLNHAREATKLASCQAIVMAQFETWLKGQIAVVAPSYELTALGRVLAKWKEIARG